MNGRNFLCSAMAAAGLAVAMCTFAAEPVGRVLLASGDAVAVRAGQQVRLAFNSPIEFKDVLRTGPASSLQVRFVDESLVSVRENSEFAIEDYQFGAKPEEQKSFFSLIKGGFRSVTGLIGRTNNANYQVRTSTSTIGIRGTDYAVRDCRGDCGAGVKDGLYGTVMGLSSGTNRITVTNNTGEQSFGINQHFYVADANTRPTPLLQPPSFVSLRPQGKAQAAQQGGSGDGGESTTGSSGASGDSRPSGTTDVSVSTPVIVQPYQVTEVLNSAGTSAALPPANGFVVIYPFRLPSSGFQIFFDDNNSSATYNSQNQLLTYLIGGTSASGSLNGGTISDTGGITLANGQTFAWGRWSGGTIVASTGQTLTNVPLLFGTASGLSNITAPFGGSATYAFAGGPRPIDAAGNVGSLTSSTLSINFTQQILSYSLGMSFPAIGSFGPATFSLSGIASKNNTFHSGEFSGSLSGSCSGGGCGSTSASGFFDVGTAGAVGYEFAVAGGGVTGTQGGSVVFLNAYTASSYTPGPAPTGQLAGEVAWAAPSIAPGSTFTTSPGFSTFDSSNNLTSFANPNPCSTGTCTLSATVGTGSIVNTGTTALVDGSTMYWGRWSGGQVTDRIAGVVTTYTPPSGVPFVLGSSNTNVPTSGSFLYTYAGGPSPTNTAGNIGTFNGGSLQVNFGATQSISTVTPINFSINGSTYSLTGSTSMTGPTSVMGNIPLSGTCTPTCTVTGGSAAAVLVGPQAGGLALDGTISGSNPTVVFAGAFKR